jgi:hypothetical protein
MLLAGDESDHRDNLGLVREPRSFESFVAVNGRTVRAWQTGCWWAGETRCDHVTQSETRADSSPLRTSTRHCIVYSIFFSIGLALDFIFSRKWIQEITREVFFLFKYRRHHGRAARLVAVIFPPEDGIYRIETLCAHSFSSGLTGPDLSRWATSQRLALYSLFIWLLSSFGHRCRRRRPTQKLRPLLAASHSLKLDC